MSPGSDELFARMHQLVTPELSGDATPDDSEQLSSMLKDNPQAIREYVTYIVDTACLRWRYALRNHDDADVARSSWRDRRRRVFAMSALAASLAAAVIVAVAIWGGIGSLARVGDVAAMRHGESHAVQTAGHKAGVATLTRLINVHWTDPESAPNELSRLDVGQTIDFVNGQVEIIFDSGAEVVLDGPSHFEIRSPLLAYSNRGTITARVGETAHGFTIETPTARIIDLGTEFGVAIGEAGVTEVAVFRGAVDLAFGESRKSPDANPSRLTQGEALRVDGAGRADRVVSIDSDRFPVAGLIRPQARKGSAIIAHVSDNIRNEQSKKFYRIVRDGLHDDSPAFVDRLHEWNGLDEQGLPQELVGAEYIMPFNDDKFATDLQVSVELLRPVRLFVFLSDSVPPPEWLTRDFVDTGLDIGLDEGPNRFRPEVVLGIGPGKSVDTVFSVWERIVDSPTTVTLGSVERPDSTAGYNMYGVAAIGL